MGSNNNTETMNNAQSLNGANIEVGMTLKFDSFGYIKGDYEMQVQYREQLRNGEIVLKGKVTKVYIDGGRDCWTTCGTLLLEPTKQYQILN